MVFSPNRYWLCAATDTCIKIWDLESKSIVDELSPEFPPIGKKAQPHYCISLCWSADGSTLFSGYTDGAIRVWSVVTPRSLQLRVPARGFAASFSYWRSRWPCSQ